MKFIDLTGQRFGFLTVAKRAENDNQGKAIWECKCDCGNMHTVSRTDLKNSHVKSCGCYTKEFQKTSHIKHGLKYTRLYRTWNDMKDRCYNPKCHAYSNYGGRGISICEEWKNNVVNFYNWAMSNGYTDELSIDRINVNGNYEPSNCRWVTMKVQQNNKTTNRIIEFNGASHNLSEWAKIFKIPYMNMKSRIKDGWSIEKISNTPVKHYKGRN